MKNVQKHHDPKKGGIWGGSNSLFGPSSLPLTMSSGARKAKEKEFELFEYSHFPWTCPQFSPPLLNRYNEEKFPVNGTIFNECPMLLEKKSQSPEFVAARKKVEELLAWSRDKILVQMVSFLPFSLFFPCLEGFLNFHPLVFCPDLFHQGI